MARFYGLYDQAGMFAPLAGPSAAALRALPGVRVHDLAGGTSRGVSAVRGEGGYMNNAGHQWLTYLDDAPLAFLGGYAGVLPADETQPTLDRAAPPWATPGV